MKTIKTYSTSVEADLARLALEAAAIPSTVVGIVRAWLSSGSSLAHPVVHKKIFQGASLMRADVRQRGNTKTD